VAQDKQFHSLNRLDTCGLGLGVCSCVLFLFKQPSPAAPSEGPARVTSTTSPSITSAEATSPHLTSPDPSHLTIHRLTSPYNTSPQPTLSHTMALHVTVNSPQVSTSPHSTSARRTSQREQGTTTDLTALHPFPNQHSVDFFRHEQRQVSSGGSPLYSDRRPKGTGLPPRAARVCAGSRKPASSA